jgi:hypothetical protein
MVQEYEKTTPVFDFETGDFKVDLQGRVVTATEAEAVVQITLKAVNTVRGVYLIYANTDDESLHHKYGNDLYNVMRANGLTEDARMSEMERAIKEALIYDPWITDITDIVIKRGKDLTNNDKIQRNDGSQLDEVYASYTIHHIFGTTDAEGVLVSG